MTTDHDAKAALLALEALQSFEVSLGSQRGRDTLRYRVTRRGNVYDNLLQQTVENTHGRGSIRERRILAQLIADRLNGRTHDT